MSLPFFISALPERSEIPLVEKQQRRQNSQSILFDEERLIPHGVGKLPWVQQSTWSEKFSWMRCMYF